MESNLTKHDIIEKMEIESFAHEGVGELDAKETLMAPNHCFGRLFTPDNICLDKCNAIVIMDGEEVHIRDLCRDLCSGGETIHENASTYYREGSGSYYVAKAIIKLGSGTLQEIEECTLRLAEVDGEELTKVPDRVYRTLTNMKDVKEVVNKTGRGKTAIWSYKDGGGEK